eukprot:CAMPEP_0174333194 /NCGR_PEP_ID=MMETSP0810-20121108/18941_1 /TAXON_ID=73025 ORGANISM="Eutreptiella gymnastica-like, Strain CCMP1594" /NCGR_SAMPLE_ID=MMETSP0810 /ASSEMBLY_ACC=CAM_ASM_000659 /LENGTH=41 /DNA_ID= /DNA_START= /DNA_END= /DNA_ORIENTATION=
MFDEEAKGKDAGAPENSAEIEVGGANSVHGVWCLGNCVSFV